MQPTSHTPNTLLKIGCWKVEVSSQEKLNISPNSFAYETSLLATQALTRGLCHVTPNAQCGGQHTTVHRLTPQAFPLLSGSMLTTRLCFFTQRDSRESWVSKHDGKTETSGYWTEPISLLHCHTDRKVNDREPPTPYPEATEPEFALFISYCVFSIDAAILLTHSFHWDSLLRLSI